MKAIPIVKRVSVFASKAVLTAVVLFKPTRNRYGPRTPPENAIKRISTVSFHTSLVFVLGGSLNKEVILAFVGKRFEHAKTRPAERYVMAAMSKGEVDWRRILLIVVQTPNRKAENSTAT